MKTFIVRASEPGKRVAHISRAVVTAETAEEAVEMVRRLYPAGMTGWKPGVIFSVETALPERAVMLI